MIASASARGNRPTPHHRRDLLQFRLGRVFERLGGLLRRQRAGENSLDAVVHNRTHRRRQVVVIVQLESSRQPLSLGPS